MLEDLDPSWSTDRATPLLPPVAQERRLAPCGECGCDRWLVVTRLPHAGSRVPRVVAVQCEDCGRPGPSVARHAVHQ